MSFHPPQDKFTVVSIFILSSYIEDDEVKKVLSQYGEIKREVIRLKYKVAGGMSLALQGKDALK